LFFFNRFELKKSTPVRNAKLKGWLLGALAVSAVYFAASGRMKMAEKRRIILETSEQYVSKDPSERIPVSQMDPLTMAELPAEKENLLGSTISVMYFFK
jgi:hypothetical protein